MDNTLTTSDGLALRLHDWPVADARGTVLIVHGLGEHIGRYAHVARHLNDWGWHAVGYDHRGHGRSAGAKGCIAEPDSLLRDLGQVVDAVRRAHPGPLVLLGHSMGGLVAARYVAEGQATPAAAWYRPVDALVLSSPALAIPMNGFQKALLALLGSLAPNLAVNNGLKPEWVSRDPKVVAAYVADPLVHDRISPKLVQFFLDNGPLVHQRAAGWAVPTLLMFAGSDRCVLPGGSRQFATAAPGSRVTTQEFAPLYHEIFNEPEQGDVFAVLSPWLKAFGGPVA
ncbi:MAG: lysophospholipase [Rhizobacter sp.]|nr:lysophospholipase [Rhizobacter sp.]